MLTPHDLETLTKAGQTANLLVQDLRELAKGNDPLLVELGLDLLQQSLAIEQRLARLQTVTKAES